MAAKIEGTYSIVESELPPITLSLEEVKKRESLMREQFGIAMKPSQLKEYCEPREEYYRERIVYVRSNNVLHLRLMYDYEVDLDRIKTPANLLNWVAHLAEKTWMSNDVIRRFIQAVAEIKGFNIHGLG
jgi:hypothetical protein